ncbi:hypothetical protein GCM10010532_112480 [Dactylosporangium siamense]|uniref:Uncharacterized protein n=1 Tax=Dactylosporangium siamense TaxID=685454 RepID=A0A919Q2I9_9ACTN|nr:hypothetical protein Dsi01nite_111440 [Dactylosporangium siamense]
MARQSTAARYVGEVVAECARWGRPISHRAALEYVRWIAADLADHHRVARRRVWASGTMPLAYEVAVHIWRVITGR